MIKAVKKKFADGNIAWVNPNNEYHNEEGPAMDFELVVALKFGAFITGKFIVKMVQQVIHSDGEKSWCINGKKY